MKTSAALWLALGTAGLGFLAARLLFHSDHEGVTTYRPADSTLQIQTFNSPVNSASSEPPALEMPDNRVPMLTERPPDPAPPVKAAEEAKPVPVIDPADPRTLPEGSLAEMEKKQEAIKQFLHERSFPILMQRLDDGLSEHVADGDTYTPTDHERMRTTIYAVRREPGQPWYRAVLPREQYPELYVYKDEMYRLENAIQERERIAAQEAAKTRR